MNKLQIVLLHDNSIEPKRATAGSVGYDLSACIDDSVEIKPGETKVVGTGVAVALEMGFAAFLYGRSGLGVKHGIAPGNCVGVIDSDYRGEIKVGLHNSSRESFTINPGDRIAQMVIARCELPELVVCDKLNTTSRAAGAFGSTGVAG